MKIRSTYLALIICLILALMVLPYLADTNGTEESPSILIGVLANRGDAIAYLEWGPTADYLSRILAPARFKIVPLPFHSIRESVESGEFSFIIANPSVYTGLEYYGLAQRIATLQVPGDPDPEALFGGVIFTRSDRDDINQIADIRGKRFVAVDPTSLGGWHAAWKEIRSAGLNPEGDFLSLNFTGTHDNSVLSVLNGSFDAGTVRSTQIERMVKEGRIDSGQIKVLNSQHQKYPNYPYLLSTSLYPEWPFAATQTADRELSKKVSISLLEMKEDDPAAIAVRGAGWAIPQDHTKVHELLRLLNLPPYENYGKPTLQEVLQQYWQTILGIIVGIAILSFLLLYTWRTKKNLSYALEQVRESEQALFQSKQELEVLNKELTSAQTRIIDSIQYGKLIQQSILPSRAELDKYLDDYVILTEPLHIVGGDFYFFKEAQNGYWIAAVDCTGHGVPGAFMTMMVNALLNRIIEIHPDDTPGAVLEKLHNLLLETLKSQSENDHLQNGLDIALCRVYPDDNILVFSGGGLPLIIAEGNTIYEIPANRVHLGFSSSRKVVSLKDTQIEIHPGMRFYLATDGVFDLPGGTMGYGLGRTGFHRLISGLNLPLRNQREQLSSNLKKFKDTWEQKDDILIVGFSVKGGEKHA